MGTINILHNAKRNPVTTIVFSLIVAGAVWLYASSVQDMLHATTPYDYCKALSGCFELNSKTIFTVIYFMMVYLTYINKQYSKWSIWLFYASVVAIILHFFFAGFVFDYVFAHVGPDHMDQIPSLARSIFGAPLYFIILSLCFVPKFIKDTLKLKEEQELTI